MMTSSQLGQMTSIYNFNSTSYKPHNNQNNQDWQKDETTL